MLVASNLLLYAMVNYFSKLYKNEGISDRIISNRFSNWPSNLVGISG